MIDLTLWLLLTIKIKELGNDNFRVRQKATEELVSMGDLPIPFLRLIAASHEDPEVRHRASGIICDWYGSISPTNYPAIPWIDQLPKEFPGRDEIVSKYLSMVPWTIEDAIFPEWPRYRTATYLMILDLIDSGKTRREVISILDSMVKIEKEYCKSNNIKLLDEK
jgi:hypothetical protein